MLVVYLQEYILSIIAKVAKLLQNIHLEFYLNSQKVVTIIIDNMINFSLRISNHMKYFLKYIII